MRVDSEVHADRFWLALVIATALGLAAFHYAQFLENSRPRWNGIVHDRSSHYHFAQTMAIALRHGDVRTFLATLEQAKVWPPVHGLCAAAVLAIGGIDYRLAVLPNLAGWVATVAFGFLLARRMSSANGNAAGIIAAVMILASPAHRIYAVDIMLESLGAAFTAMALLFYVVAKQETSVRAWRRFAITLTLLFFEKYNYWLLVVLALIAAELFAWRAAEWRSALGGFLRINWPRVLEKEVRQPLTWIFLTVAIGAGALFLLKPEPLQIGRQHVSLYPPNNLITVAYAALFLRVLLARSWRGITIPAQRQLLAWHILPLAISFLLPRRLSLFAWYISPLNNARSSGSVLDAGAFYSHAAVTHYHLAGWSGAFAAMLFLFALITLPRLRRGSLAVALFVLIAAALTLVHPDHKSRYLHTLFALLWAVGAAGLMSSLNQGYRFRRPLAFGIAAIILLVHAVSLPQTGHAGETGSRGETTSLLDLTDAYLPELAGKRVALFSNLPCGGFLLWTYQERYPDAARPELPVKNYDLSLDRLRDRLQQWASETQADAIVFVDIPPDSPEYVPVVDYSIFGRIGEIIRADSRFHLSKEWRIAERGCTVSLWSRE